MAVWATDPLTLRLLTYLGIPWPTQSQIRKQSVAQTPLRQPMSRQPSKTLPGDTFGTFAEGSLGGDGSITGDIGTGTHGVSTEGLTAAGYAQQFGNAARGTAGLIGTFTFAIGAPVNAVVAGVKALGALTAKALGFVATSGPTAEEDSLAAADLAQQAEAEHAFAVENPFTATVLSTVFGIHATAQPTAEELAIASESAHFAAVDASLGITGPGQGFAYSGSPTGFVNSRGEPLDISPKGREDNPPDNTNDPNANPPDITTDSPTGIPDAPPGQANAPPDVSATPDDGVSDGGGGTGGTSGGSDAGDY